MGWDEYGDYESAADRRARIERKVEARRSAGEPFVPTICKVKRGLPAQTFWGKAWCQNLEAYSDYESRLPRGRTYLRQGTVYDLDIKRGRVRAFVTGSEIYEVEITIQPLDAPLWDDLKSRLAGEVTNLVDLLSGELGTGVLQTITDSNAGLFPAPSEIHLNCNCMDWADCCKHVAAVMYAIGVRLDTDPDLFFKLRGVEHTELMDAAAFSDLELGPIDRAATEADRIGLEPDDLCELFGIDLADPESAWP